MDSEMADELNEAKNYDQNDEDSELDVT